MPRRKPVASRPDPATAASLQTLNPHAAGIDIGATELWVCVPPSAVVAPAAPSAPATLPPHVRRFGDFTADLETIADWLRQCQVTTWPWNRRGCTGSALRTVRGEGVQVLLVDPRQVERAPGAPRPTPTTASGSSGCTVSAC